MLITRCGGGPLTNFAPDEELLGDSGVALSLFERLAFLPREEKNPPVFVDGDDDCPATEDERGGKRNWFASEG